MDKTLLEHQLNAHLTITDNELYIGFSLDNESTHAYSFKTIKLPKNKNLVTYEWILNKLKLTDKTDYYNTLKQLALKLNISNHAITTYGYMLSHNQYNTIKTLLDNNNIQYNTINHIYHVRLELLTNKKNIDNMNKLKPL